MLLVELLSLEFQSLRLGDSRINHLMAPELTMVAGIQSQHTSLGAESHNKNS